MKPFKLLLLAVSFLSYGSIFAQNVGIGTKEPANPLHVKAETGESGHAVLIENTGVKGDGIHIRLQGIHGAILQEGYEDADTTVPDLYMTPNILRPQLFQRGATVIDSFLTRDDYTLDKAMVAMTPDPAILGDDTTRDAHMCKALNLIKNMSYYVLQNDTLVITEPELTLDVPIKIPELDAVNPTTGSIFTVDIPNYSDNIQINVPDPSFDLADYVTDFDFSLSKTIDVSQWDIIQDNSMTNFTDVDLDDWSFSYSASAIPFSFSRTLDMSDYVDISDNTKYMENYIKGFSKSFTLNKTIPKYLFLNDPVGDGSSTTPVDISIPSFTEAVNINPPETPIDIDWNEVWVPIPLKDTTIEVTKPARDYKVPLLPPGVSTMSDWVDNYTLTNFPQCTIPEYNQIPGEDILLFVRGILDGSSPMYDPLSAPRMNNEYSFITFTDKDDRWMGAIQGQDVADWAYVEFNEAAIIDLASSLVFWPFKIESDEFMPPDIDSYTKDLLDVSVTMVNWGVQTLDSYQQFGVMYNSGHGDYAEWLERMDPNEIIEYADIVGVKGGKISKDLEGAEQILVVSKAPIVRGNAPEPEKEHLGENIAFMGQVPVKVMGPVSSGDFIVADTERPGFGKAISPSEMTPQLFSLAVGRSWETNELPGLKMVNTLVGMHNGAWTAPVGKMQQELQELQEAQSSTEQQLKELLQRVNQLETMSGKVN